jgi:hypothetical protein
MFAFFDGTGGNRYFEQKETNLILELKYKEKAKESRERD